MSVITHVKSLIVANLNADKRVKKAVLDLLNAIDNDLSIGGYEQSSEVDNALIDLDKALIEIDEEIEQSKKIAILPSSVDEEEDEIELHGFKDRTVGDDDDEEENDSRPKQI